MSTPDDFCRALVQNERRDLKRVIDAVLEAQKTSDAAPTRMQELLQWVQGQPCVAAARLARGFLEREPPVQELIVELTDRALSEAPPQLGKHRTLGITHAPGKLHFDYR